MYRIVPYILLFVATMLLQIFLFDNLVISIYFNPLVYIAFILLLPLELSHISLLGLGLMTGLAMDSVMGSSGLNTLATLPVAFLRPWLVGLFCNREDAREGGVPSQSRFGTHKFVKYLIFGVVLHHGLFFALESLSWAYAWHTLLRVMLSSAASVFFIWLIARIFTAKFSTRV